MLSGTKRYSSSIDFASGPKVFDTQTHKKRFELYSDAELGLNKSGEEKA